MSDKYSQVTFNWFLLSSPVQIGEEFDRELEFDNQTSDDLPPPGVQGRVFCEPDQYYERTSSPIPTVESFEKRKAILKFRPKGGVTIYNLQPTFTLIVKNQRNLKEEYIKKVCYQTMTDYTGYLLNAKSPFPTKAPRMNILLFGIAGAAKSSFINSIYTLLHPDIAALINPVVSGGGGKHVTTSLARFDLPGTNISIYDTWGLTPLTYTGSELEKIVNGELPPGFNMGEDPNLNKIDQEHVFKAQRTPKEHRRIHAILFFVTQASLNDPGLEKVRKLISSNFEIISHIKPRPLAPRLVITRADEVNPKIRKQPLEVFTDIEELKRKASTLLNIPQMRTHTCVNYTTEKQKSFEIDRSNYEILEKSVRDCIDFLSVDPFQ